MRFFLRQRTSAVHAKVDALVGDLDSKERYVAYLLGLLSFREPIEAMLRSKASQPFLRGWRPAPISASIRADLRDLKISVPERVVLQPPLAEESHSVSAMLGILYVLEGSALGARQLYMRAAALGFSGTFGARHLAHQIEDKQRWRSFLNLLESHDPIEADATAQASLAAFEFALEAFSRAPGESRRTSDQPCN